MQEFLQLVKLNSELDPFYKEHSGRELFNWLSGEVDEALEEYEKWNYSELESELWDVIWNLFVLFEKLSDEGEISRDGVIDKIVDKISRRKAFLLKWREVTKKEAQDIWNKAKREEWYSEDRLWND